MAGKSDRATILKRLRAEIDGGFAIYDALCGSGITAKMAARGGASMVTTHSLAFFRMQGLSSMAGYLPICDANALTLELGERQLGGLILVQAPLYPGDSGASVVDVRGDWLGLIRGGLAVPGMGGWPSSTSEPGTDPGCFNIPHNIVTDAAGLVYVADRENSRVQIFDSGGKYLGQWNNLHRPCGVSLCVVHYSWPRSRSPSSRPCRSTASMRWKISRAGIAAAADRRLPGYRS